MKLTEILRLVWLNLSANKSKVILTSTGIIVGAATIMLVIAIGTGGREEVAEQFRNLNAGAIDITYEYQGRLGWLWRRNAGRQWVWRRIKRRRRLRRRSARRRWYTLRRDTFRRNVHDGTGRKEQH